MVDQNPYSSSSAAHTKPVTDETEPDKPVAKRKRSPWVLTGTLIGTALGFVMAPINLKIGDDLIIAVWTLGGSLLGLVFGIAMDIRERNLKESVGEVVSTNSENSETPRDAGE